MDRKESIASLEAQITEMKAELDRKQKEAAALSEKLLSLQEQLDRVSGKRAGAGKVLEADTVKALEANTVKAPASEAAVPDGIPLTISDAKPSGTEKFLSSKPRKNRPAFFCLLIGILLLVFNLVMVLPIYLPRLAGYQAFFITTGSMDPAIPTGSIAYFRSADASALQPGEVIAYTSSDGIVVVHRVKSNNTDDGYLLAKGDNNKILDKDRIPYDHVHGVYAGFMPGVGKLMYFWHSPAGRIGMILIAAAGSVLICISIFLRKRSRNVQIKEPLP